MSATVISDNTCLPPRAPVSLPLRRPPAHPPKQFVGFSQHLFYILKLIYIADNVVFSFISRSLRKEMRVISRHRHNRSAKKRRTNVDIVPRRTITSSMTANGSCCSCGRNTCPELYQSPARPPPAGDADSKTRDEIDQRVDDRQYRGVTQGSEAGSASTYASVLGSRSS